MPRTGAADGAGLIDPRVANVRQFGRECPRLRASVGRPGSLAMQASIRSESVGGRPVTAVVMCIEGTGDWWNRREVVMEPEPDAPNYFDVPFVAPGPNRAKTAHDNKLPKSFL
jgi:hypothetical protein